MTDTDTRGYSYSKKCWSCGSVDMEDLGDYVKCRSCKATWNDMPHISGPLVESGHVTLTLKGDVFTIRAKHPSAGVKRRVARARKRA